MSARIIAADLPKLAERSPLAQYLRAVLRTLLGRFTAAGNMNEHALAVEDRVAIGPKKSLVLVRCHGRRFLIASAGDTIGPFIEVATPESTRRGPKPFARERKA